MGVERIVRNYGKQSGLSIGFDQKCFSSLNVEAGLEVVGRDWPSGEVEDEVVAAE